MTFDIVDFLIIFVEIICCNLFFDTYSRKKSSYFTTIMLILLLTVCCYSIVYCFPEQMIIRELIFIIVTGIIMKNCKGLGILKAIIISVLFQSLLLVVDYCGFSFISYFFLSYEKMEDKYLLEGHLVIAFCKMCLFLIVMIINRKANMKSKDVLADSEWIRFMFFPIFTIGIITAMISEFQYVITQRQANLLFVMAIGLVGMNIFVFYLINDVMDRERKIYEDKVFILQAQNQMNMYKSKSENFNIQNRKMHDYKNQILCIEGLLQQHEYEKAKEYTRSISGSLNQEMNVINTNHAIVNAILNTKYQEAVEKGIVLVIKVNDLSNIWLKDEHVVVILSNLLDNAIEATEKCKEKRYIKLKFVHEDNIIISIKNTFSGVIEIKDGKIITTKKDKEEHGIGISNIIETVKMYHGSHTIRNEGKEFYVSILIPKEN